MSGQPADPVLQALPALAEAEPEVAVLWLYGSRARGKPRPDSDYDLAVAFRTFLPDDPLQSRLRPEILALDWARLLNLAEGRLSVIDVNQVSIPLAHAAVDGGQVLYCRDPARLLAEQRRVWSRMELDVWHHLPEGRRAARIA